MKGRAARGLVCPLAIINDRGVPGVLWYPSTEIP